MKCISPSTPTFLTIAFSLLLLDNGRASFLCSYPTNKNSDVIVTPSSSFPNTCTTVALPSKSKTTKKKLNTLFYSSVNDEKIKDSTNNDDDKSRNVSYSSSSSSLTLVTEADLLRKQAEQLRKDADSIRVSLDEEKLRKEKEEIERVDRWLNELLVASEVAETQMLNTVDKVADLLKEKRYSADMVNRVFDRICETSLRQQSINNCSPLIELLLDAACKVDCMERSDNPNKRWNHRVERDLRKKLFALGWGINIDEVNEEKTVRALTGEKDYS